MNNDERHEWISNDEGLYRWWKGTRLSMRTFIRENREAIDRCIKATLDGERQGQDARVTGW